MLRLMRQGRKIAMIPGGYEEATIMEYGKPKLFLKKKTGWIKYALQHGYNVIPVYSFGEEWSFRTFKWFTDLRLWLNKYKIITIGFISSKWYLPENDMRIVTIYGKPI